MLPFRTNPPGRNIYCGFGEIFVDSIVHLAIWIDAYHRNIDAAKFFGFDSIFMEDTGMMAVR